MPAAGHVHRSYDFTQELYRRLDNYRFQAKHRTEAEAVRYLLDLGLKAEAVRLAETEPKPGQWSQP